VRRSPLGSEKAEAGKGSALVPTKDGVTSKSCIAARFSSTESQSAYRPPPERR